MTRTVRVNLNAATLTWQCRGGLRVVDASVTVTRCAEPGFAYRWSQLPDEAVVDKQIAAGRGGASDRFELNRRQPVEQSSSATSDHRRDHEPELVDDVCGKQRLGHRDAGVDSDVASRPDFQITDEFDQAAVDRSRVGPLRLERCGCRDELR